MQNAKINRLPKAGQEKRSMFAINAVSIIVLVVVAVLLSFPNKIYLGEWTRQLSHAIGIINSLTTVVLLAGLFFIWRNNINAHRIAMTAAFSLGAVFLVLYVTYHVSNPSNKFQGAGAARYIYFFVLITHIAFSAVVLPLVLRAMYFAVTKQFDRHKKIARFAYPIWLYVSVTGVTVYLMLYQLFPAK